MSDFYLNCAIVLQEVIENKKGFKDAFYGFLEQRQDFA